MPKETAYGALRYGKNSRKLGKRRKVRKNEKKKKNNSKERKG